VKKVPELPKSYTNVKPADISKNPNLLVKQGQSLPDLNSFKLHLEEEFTWLEKVLHTNEVNDTPNTTWRAHHASQSRSPLFEVTITPLEGIRLIL